MSFAHSIFQGKLWHAGGNGRSKEVRLRQWETQIWLQHIGAQAGPLAARVQAKGERILMDLAIGACAKQKRMMTSKHGDSRNGVLHMAMSSQGIALELSA